MAKWIFISLLLLCVACGHAQENLGINLSNHAPVNTLELNPASIADSRVYIDINLIGFNAYARQDHTFFPADGTNLFTAISGDLPLPIQSSDSTFRSGIVDFAIDGPGAVVNFGRSSIGLTSRYRMHVDINNMPYELAQMIYRNFRHSPYYDRPFDVQNMTINFMDWYEVGLTGAQMMQVTDDHHLNAGLTVKKLIKRSHAGFSVEQGQYTFTSDHLFIDNMVADIATALPGSQGGGWAFDLGLMFKRTINGNKKYVPYNPKSRCSKSDYLYKIGLSVLDIGSIRHRGSSENTRISDSQIFWPNIRETNMNGIEGLDEIIDLRFENDQVEFENTSDYTVSLPTALSVHGDYRLQEEFYMGAAVVQHLSSPSLHALRRGDVVGLIPRYEKQNFEFSMPLSLYDYSDFQAGMAVRWKFLILGTDDILPMFFTKAYGMDLYFDLKVPIFFKSNCGGAGRKKKLITPCWGD